MSLSIGLHAYGISTVIWHEGMERRDVGPKMSSGYHVINGCVIVSPMKDVNGSYTSESVFI